MYPAKQEFENHGTKIWGRMPSGEIKEFESLFKYRLAYQAELDEFVDEMARLEYERMLELPEDFRYA